MCSCCASGFQADSAKERRHFGTRHYVPTSEQQAETTGIRHELHGIIVHTQHLCPGTQGQVLRLWQSLGTFANPSKCKVPLSG